MQTNDTQAESSGFITRARQRGGGGVREPSPQGENKIRLFRLKAIAQKAAQLMQTSQVLGVVTCNCMNVRVTRDTLRTSSLTGEL